MLINIENVAHSRNAPLWPSCPWSFDAQALATRETEGQTGLSYNIRTTGFIQFPNLDSPLWVE